MVVFTQHPQLNNLEHAFSDIFMCLFWHFHEFLVFGAMIVTTHRAEYTHVICTEVFTFKNKDKITNNSA